MSLSNYELGSIPFPRGKRNVDKMGGVFDECEDAIPKKNAHTATDQVSTPTTEMLSPGTEISESFDDQFDHYVRQDPAFAHALSAYGAETCQLLSVVGASDNIPYFVQQRNVQPQIKVPGPVDVEQVDVEQVLDVEQVSELCARSGSENATPKLPPKGSAAYNAQFMSPLPAPSYASQLLADSAQVSAAETTDVVIDLVTDDLPVSSDIADIEEHLFDVWKTRNEDMNVQ